MIYDVARVKRLSTKFQVNLGGDFFGGVGGRGIGLQSKSILTDPHNGRKSLYRILVTIGPIGWEEFDDRQTDRRQTDR